MCALLERLMDKVVYNNDFALVLLNVLRATSLVQKVKDGNTASRL